MTRNYKPAYPTEFRHQMEELVALGRCPKQLSKEFGCHYTSIQAWCRAVGVQYRPQVTTTTFALSGAPLNSNERQELMELRKKLKRVEMERDLLAKAMAWFTNNKD